MKKKEEPTQAVKAPKKYQKDNWFVVRLIILQADFTILHTIKKENYTGERIEFDVDEIQLKQSLFIENCNDCTILVKGKVKSVFVNKCKKTNVLVTVRHLIYIVVHSNH